MKELFKPRFDIEGLEFFREENESYASFISPGDASKALQLLNPTVLEIARLCDGNRTVEEIRQAYKSTYPEADTEHVDKNVTQALTLLRQYGLLTADPDEDMRAARPERFAAEGGAISRRLTEHDFMSMRQLLVGCQFPVLQVIPRIFYQNPYLPSELYSELFVRARLFNYKETFFGTFVEGALKFLLGIIDNRPIKPVGTVSIIVGTEGSDLENELKRLLPLIVEEMKRFHRKLVWHFMVNKQTPEKTLHAVAEKLGWAQAYSLEDEFGEGVDEVVYELRMAEESAAGKGG